MMGSRKAKSVTSLLWTLLLFFWAVSPVSALEERAIEAALAHPNLRGASVGIEIRSMTTGRVVFARGAREALIAASNTKLFTTASALHHLGIAYDWATRVYARGALDQGVLRGDLVLCGGGDPCLSARFHEEEPLAPLQALAGFVTKAGIREVRGCLLLDDTLFDREYVAPGWPEDQLEHYYCAPVSALSCLENLVEVEVIPAASAGQPAHLALVPRGAPFAIEGKILTTSHKNENVIRISRPRSNGCIRVEGRTSLHNPSSRTAVTVRNPPRYFGALFLKALERAGVSVAQGMVLAEDAPDYESSEIVLLGSLGSDLLKIVTLTNKKSLNHYAEQLFKLTGWKVAGKGTFATGEAAVQKMFLDLGIRDADPFRMEDGSGLSRGNRFSAHTIVSLLQGLYASPLRDPFVRSLPIAGVDGSLERRMSAPPYRSRIRGKTGWIREVSALSGYAQSLSGEVYAFSILFNGYQGSNAVMKSIQDGICRAMVDG